MRHCVEVIIAYPTDEAFGLEDKGNLKMSGFRERNKRTPLWALLRLLIYSKVTMQARRARARQPLRVTSQLPGVSPSCRPLVAHAENQGSALLVPKSLSSAAGQLPGLFMPAPYCLSPSGSCAPRGTS